jgi:hypothetical protein
VERSVAGHLECPGGESRWHLDGSNVSMRSACGA